MTANGKSVTPVYVSELDACPSCGEDWLGPDIPEESRHHYGGKTHFSKVIGVYDTGLDRTVAWRCPACGNEWDRNAVATLIGSTGARSFGSDARGGES